MTNARRSSCENQTPSRLCGPAGPAQPAHEPQDRTGRIGRQRLLDERRHLRAEQADILGERGVKAGDRERVGRRAAVEEVTVLPHEIAQAAQRSVVAIGDVGERRLLPQPRRQRFADGRELCRRRALDGEKNDARRSAAADLLGQHLLRGRGRARQKRRHIGANLRSRDDGHGENDEQKPEPERRGAANGHRACLRRYSCRSDRRPNLRC